MVLRQRRVTAADVKNKKMITSADDKNNVDKSPPATDEQQDDELSMNSLIPAIIVSSLVSVGSYYSCDYSIDMMEDVLVATLRTVMQLSLLAAMLSPLFKFVEQKTTTNNTSSSSSSSSVSAPFMVLGYVFLFMLPLAAFEASSRSKLTLLNDKIVLLIVMFSLFTAVSIMGAVAIFAIVKPKPWYNPRHVIPLCGMLFNNALSAISLALDILFTELQSKQRETIELMICFGADPWTATRSSFRSVLASSLKPQINSMNVIGLVAIPGMMTGQVLGGASPQRAARYQIIIMCLILGANWISTSMTTELVIWNAFDSKGSLRDDWIVDNDSLRVSQVVSSAFSFLSRTRSSFGQSTISESQILLDAGHADKSIVDVKLFTKEKISSDSSTFFQAEINGLFANGIRRMDANFTIPKSGDIVILKGQSGIGKSTLLRTMAMLNSGLVPSSSSIYLSGEKSESFIRPHDWRKKVLYLPQQRSALQGTPLSFLQFIASLHHQTLESLTLQTTRYMESFGIQSAQTTLLEQPWSKLSGGESQRALLAIALATKPKLLILDEATNALDMDSKLKVEESLKMFSANNCAIIVVTHDEEQMSRIGNVHLSLDVVP